MPKLWKCTILIKSVYDKKNVHINNMNATNTFLNLNFFVIFHISSVFHSPKAWWNTGEIQKMLKYPPILKP